MSNVPDIEIQREMYRKMLVVRRLEETLGELHAAGKTRGPLNRCDGQEAAGVGATAPLQEDDYVCTTHRGHAHYVGKGLNVRRIVAEIFGRETGYCKGRAGHMLVADAQTRMLGGNAIVGAGMPMAVGQALAIQLAGGSQVAMACFGDGAAQTGICHESMNMAALWKLPMIFFLEHNFYGLTVHSRAQSSVEDLVVRADAYNMPGVKVDGNDVVAVYQAVNEAIVRARRGDGPTLIEAKKYRMTGFSTSDMGGYQPAAEMEQWRANDPIRRTHDHLVGSLGEEALDRIRADATREVAEAFDLALSDPFPPVDDVYRGEYVA